MIWAFLGYLIYSAFSGSNEPMSVILEKARERAVAVASTQAAASKVEEAFDALDITFGEAIGGFRAKEETLLDLLRQHDSSPNDIRSLLDDASILRAKTQRAVIDARFVLRDAMTREQWDAVFNKGFENRETAEK